MFTSFYNLARSVNLNACIHSIKTKTTAQRPNSMRAKWIFPINVNIMRFGIWHCEDKTKQCDEIIHLPNW